MGDNAVFAAQQRRVTEQLGAAMLAAVGLMVRQYLGVPTGENEGQDSADAAWEDGAQAFRAGETVNESFDMARYLRLRQGASAAELAWQAVKAFVMVVVASIVPALITARQDPARSLRSM